jgi:hypothetical protein
MLIHVSLDEGKLRVKEIDRDVPISCDVRNELNGRRGPGEVVFTMPGGRPYYPRQFPRGRWRVTDVRARADPYRAPFFIATDAYQEVEEWITEDGPDHRPRYVRPSGRRVVDMEYGLHASTSPTTTGCIKIMHKADLLALVDLIRPALARGEPVEIEVS